MIKSNSYNITLGYEEVDAVERHQREHGDKSFCTMVSGADFSANCYGVTVQCVSDRQATELWEAVLTAMPDEDDEDET